MALHEGYFYKTCAMYPVEASQESPCKSMTALTNSPVHGEPIRVTEDTTMWSIPGVKVGKPHSCYLVRYDPTTSIGVVFLGTRSPSYPHRFVRVHGGIEPETSGMLTTIPPAAFNEVFYLNLSHPLRVKLLFVAPPNNLNSLRLSGFGLTSTLGPPPVGITNFHTLGPRLLVSLDSTSEDTFWKLHKAYHIARPRRRSSLGLAGGGSSAARGASAGVGGGGSGVGTGSDAGGGSAVEGGGLPAAGVPGWTRGGGGTLVEGGAHAGVSVEDEGLAISEDAPWGRIGSFRIGIDICCILDDGSEGESDDESYDERMLVEDDSILDGTMVAFLTTGWSVFVSAKRLQAGDSVLFIRDDKGQLLLGIRRANRQQTVVPSSVLSSDSMHFGVLAATSHAAATSSRFKIFYNPRQSPSEFVIPLAKYHKAVYNTQWVCASGWCLKPRNKCEKGTITGLGDIDSARWPK